jgi:hypothetical protein
MANGYIGKISAIVTASTADLSRKLQGSTREVNRFANSVRSQIGTASRSAQASLNDIFTAAQKVERALQAGTTLRNRRGIALIDPGEADRIRRVVSVAQGINRPAIAAKRSFESLSLEIRGALQPALERMQRQVDFVNSRIEVFGRVSPAAFERTQRTIRETTIAINQLAQAQQRLGTLATGNELEFSDPRLAGNLAAAQRAGQRALALPSRAIESDPQIAGLLQQINAVSTRATEAAARVKASLGNPALLAEATKESERLNGVLERLVARVSRKISVIVDTERAGRSLDALKEQLEQTLTGRPANFDQVAAEYQRLRGEVEKLEVAQRQAFAAGLGELITLIASGDVANLERARTLIEQIGRGLEGIKPAAPDRLSAASDRLRERAERERQAADAREAELEVSRGQRSNIPVGRRGRARILASLGGEIDVVDRKVRELPESLRSQLGPQVNQIKNEFRRLGRDGVGFAAEQADRLAVKAREITAALNNRQARGRQFLEAFGGAGEAGLNLGIDDRQLRGIESEFAFLQDRIAAVSAETRGPLVAAMQRYRQVVKQAFDGGTISTRQGQKAIADSRNEVVRLAAALLNVKPERLATELKRVGDVARGAGSRASLAIQQAAFAVDDFFSVTGGLDQRIRAAGNNISQLGFILGSTEGLVIGIAASIGAQLVTALIKWSNAGTEAQDRTKALNEALARQKSLVEDLAQAFDSLGDRLLRGVFSPAAEEAREVARQIDEIRKKQRELRDATVVDLDPEVNRQRAIRGARERQLENEEDIGRRTALQEQIAEARRAEQAAAQAAINRPAPTPREIQEVLLAAAGGNTQGGLAGALRNQEVLRRRALTREQVEAAGGDQRQLLEILRTRRAELLPASLQSELTSNEAAPARFAVQQLTGLIERIERELAVGINEAGNELIQSVESPAKRLRDAQGSLREAVEAGVPGAVALLNSVDQIGAGLDGAVQTIVKRFEEGLPLDQATVDAATKQRDAALANVEATLREVAAIDSVRRSLEAFGDALDRVADQLANTLAQEARSAADQARRNANREQGLLDGGLGGRQEEVDRAQRRQAVLEEQARAAELRAAERTAATLRAINKFEQDVLAGRLGDEPQQLIARRDAAQATLDAEGVAGPARREAEAVLAVVRVQLQQIFEQSDAAQAARRFADALDAAAASVAGQQDAIDRGRELLERPGERAGRELNRDIEALNAAFAENQGLEIQPGEGAVPANEFRRELLESDRAFQQAVRAREQELGRALGPDEAFNAVGRDGVERVATLRGREAAVAPFREFIEAFDRLNEDRLRREAPAIFGLADQVANAVIQGPSRAALQATDVSTVEGSRELNRLLRGDDSARDQNLVELQKQSTILEDMLTEIRQGGADVAN